MKLWAYTVRQTHSISFDCWTTNESPWKRMCADLIHISSLFFSLSFSLFFFVVHGSWNWLLLPSISWRSGSLKGTQIPVWFIFLFFCLFIVLQNVYNQNCNIVGFFFSGSLLILVHHLRWEQFSFLLIVLCRRCRRRRGLIVENMMDDEYCSYVPCALCLVQSIHNNSL